MTANPQRRAILQKHFVDPIWTWPNGSRLPGVGPVAADDWLRVDDAFAGQMALRDRLIADESDRVIALLPKARDAALEVLDLALARLPGIGPYKVAPDRVTRPDGLVVDIDYAAPMATLGRLVQEDICLLEEDTGGHVLTGAVLCFPAHWTLAEKLGRPMTQIHDPVPEYQSDMAKRVQRMLTALRPGTTLRRGNCLAYEDFALFQPRLEAARYTPPGPDAAFVRTERQCLFKLPASGAVVFSIHTCVLDRQHLSAQDEQNVAALLGQHVPD